MIELRETQTMGWGVFATEPIAEGEEITRNTAEPFTSGDWDNVSKGPFGPLVFLDKTKYAQGIHSGFLALGTITKVNHDNEPNATVETTTENGLLEAVLTSLRKIQKGEQLFISYTNIGDYGFAA